MPNLIRSFIAIPLTSAIHQKLEDFTRTYGLAERASGLRSVKPENIHLTLKFLGDIDTTRIPAISARLEELTNKNSSFPVTVRGIGAFPGWRNKPRIIWVGVQPVEPIQHIFQGVEAVTTAIGYPSENRPFSPHLTLARVNQQFASPRQAETITRLMNLNTEPVFGEMIVGELVLFRSVLQPAGPIYSVLSRHSFSA